MDFIFEQIPVGGDRNFAYLLGDRDAKVAAVIDPAFKPEEILGRAGAQGLTLTHILNTHGHEDHVNGNPWLRSRTGALVVAHRSASPLPDLPVEDGEVVDIGSIKVRVLHVPGHADDHLLFYLPEQRVAITGDLLFVGKIGGTSTEEQARTEFKSLRRVLRELPGETTIWPGHDFGCRPSSTLALEIRTNPFLLAADFAVFLQLKREWPDYKARMGLV